MGSNDGIATPWFSGASVYLVGEDQPGNGRCIEAQLTVASGALFASQRSEKAIERLVLRTDDGKHEWAGQEIERLILTMPITVMRTAR